MFFSDCHQSSYFHHSVLVETNFSTNALVHLCLKLFTFLCVWPIFLKLRNMGTIMTSYILLLTIEYLYQTLQTQMSNKIYLQINHLQLGSPWESLLLNNLPLHVSFGGQNFFWLKHYLVFLQVDIMPSSPSRASHNQYHFRYINPKTGRNGKKKMHTQIFDHLFSITRR